MRSLEDHLSPQELASLPESAEALNSSGPDQQQVRQHLQQCEACSSLAQAHWNLLRLCASSASEVGSGACPPEAVWLEFAAGLRPEQSSSLLAHAASCSSCAVALQEAMMLMQPDQLDESGKANEPIEGLASSTPEWQSQVAVRMMSAVGSSSSAEKTVVSPKLTLVQRIKLRPVWITLPLAAAILLAVAISSVAVWRLAHPSDARLLALSYNKQRTLVLRIPGGDPVPLASGTRGPSAGFTDPTELLELRLRAQRHLDQVPNSPYWHQVLGEVDLLEQDGNAARRNLEIAQTTDENLPNLQLDLAAAWFEIGDKTGNAEAYAQAAELYSKLLHDHPADPALLYYNRALCWERQNLVENALDDLRAALPLEKSSAWRKAIEDEIARLSSHSATTPTDGYEAALGNATVNLLPHWTDSPDARVKLAQVAALGLSHRDRWLQDWTAANHSARNIEADQQLALAIADGSAGKAQSSLAAAVAAIQLYKMSGQRPGLLRAQVAEVYAFQRLGRAKECIETATRVERELGSSQYARLEGQALLDKGICESRAGDATGAQATLSRAVSIANLCGFPLLKTDAISMQASSLDFRGMSAEAWQIDTDGLKFCEQVRCPPTRTYKFLYDLVRDAQDLGLTQTAVVLMSTAEKLAALSDDATTRAYGLETLGIVAGRAGDYETSSRAFAAASRTGDRAALVKLNQAEWQVDQAEILSKQGKPQAALNLLEQSVSAVAASDYEPVRVAFYTQISTAQLSLGRYDDALAGAESAVQETERTLATLHSDAERQQWTRENSPVYEELVKVHLHRGDNTAALQAWERFRSIGYAPFIHFNASDPAGPSTDARVVVLARVGDRYVGWLARVRPLQALRTVVLGDQHDLERSANVFYRLCADPDSDLPSVREVGRRLYTSLLTPFADQLGTLDHLWIDLDPSLSVLPVAALSSPGGGWLGDTTSITILSPWWALDPTLALAEPTITRAMKMLIVSGFDRVHSSESETSDIGGIFAHSTMIDGTLSKPQDILSALGSAEIFHFSGHATAGSSAHLLLASGDGETLSSLAPESLGKVHLQKCRLAVLAACNTSAADPDQVEKIPDLRNSLLISGAGSVVASNWDVDDLSTRSLILAFYKQLALGLSPSHALQIAQQTIHSTGGWQHPYYWAAFEVFSH
jgi:CHAT domain-containing protein